MAYRFTPGILLLGLFLAQAGQVMAGEVIVRREPQAFDAFAARDQAAEEWRRQQSLKLAEQQRIWHSLPVDCLTLKGPVYLCGDSLLYPVNRRGVRVFIQLQPHSLIKTKE
ncbi:hypothetical protein [Shewanella sedimentimangrovi]|uniref:Uncharacterized protein n=1 Tax=Shewanella sedimentimangrovi TaxID=2814293 RepID=A0ABX7R085_9GAMM|nr:hypothetical protein [Shewanella sedimentimangrovi]QSX36596.1 hypothetical protein JYB85_15095 [Shewanella sedimentimangrovi]